MRAHGSSVFAAADAFHFDNVRAQIAQYHTRRGAGHDGAQVKYANALQ
jgi:hypothetical protein